MCLQINRKLKTKKKAKNKNKKKVEEEQDDTKDSSPIFVCRGVVFLFLN